ncbi:MAG: YfbK domain-containing protein, partial [Longimicrobiales bacterium]
PMRTVPFLTVLLALATGSAAIAARATLPPVATSTATVFVGHVTDDAGAALAGARVQVSGTAHGAIADAVGAYRFIVPAGAVTRDVWVEAALIGYEKEARRVRVEGDTVRINFALTAARIALDELVTNAAPPMRDERQRQTGAKVMERQALAPAGIDAARAAMSMAVAPAVGGRVAHLPHDPGFNTEAYDPIAENPFLSADANPLSTFSIDVDRASYGNVRRFINEGQLPPRDAVRIEELLNYFTYDDALPTGEHPFAVTTQLGPAPWSPRHELLRIGLRSRAIDTAALPPGNLVFLIDVSGSMQSPDKLPLLKQAFGLLIDQLRPQDQVAIVVYAGAAGLVLPATSGDRKDVIMAAIDQLEAGGSTAGGAGLRLAYDIALQHFIRGGNNRVILATDGDFNIGESSDAAMVRLIEEKRRQGTFLTVLGFGTGNLKDAKMEKLADHGNGNYAYIDELMEARKVLVNEIGGTLVTVAKDVKLQVEFNPARVRAYRLIGYENRLLAAEDFDDDAKDAGELGAGHSVTALYEIVQVGVETDANIRGVDSLRYRRTAQRTQRAASDELAYVKIRYKQPDADTSIRFDQPVADRATPESADFTFSAAVAAFGLVLRESEHRGSATFDQVIALASDAIGEDRGGYRTQFVELVEKARALNNTIASDQDGRRNF